MKDLSWTEKNRMNLNLFVNVDLSGTQLVQLKNWQAEIDNYIAQKPSTLGPLMPPAN